MNENVVDFPTYECSHADTPHPTLLLPIKKNHKDGSTVDGDQDDGDLSHNICNFLSHLFIYLFYFEEKKTVFFLPRFSAFMCLT